VIKAARDAYGIGPEAFFRYLEARDIQPCVELLSQVRIIRQKKAQKTKLSLLRQNMADNNKSRVGFLLSEDVVTKMRSSVHNEDDDDEDAGDDEEEEYDGDEQQHPEVV
jgi:hypothetical protein